MTSVSRMLCISLVVLLAAPAASAGFAGENGRIYFATSKKGGGLQTDIFSMTPRGTDIRRVADLPGHQREPAISPDTSELAFWSFGGASSGLWTMGIDGSDPTELVALRSNAQAAFTADGEAIAYHDLVELPNDEFGEHIYTVPSDGSGPGGNPLIVGPADKHRWPTFSSDGTKLAFTQYDARPAIASADWNVYFANAAGGDPERITNLPGNEYGPDFAPNGRRIAFWARGRTDESDIFTVRVDGTHLRRLTPRDGISEWVPDYSPNGRKIVYQRKLGENVDIFKMNVDGSHRRAVTHLQRAAVHPEWAHASPVVPR